MIRVSRDSPWMKIAAGVAAGLSGTSKHDTPEEFATVVVDLADAIVAEAVRRDAEAYVEHLRGEEQDAR